MSGRRSGPPVVVATGRRVTALRAVLEEAGVTVEHRAVIAIQPPDDPGPLQEAAARLEQFDWIAFTSAAGVEALRGARGDAPWLPPGVRSACAGPACARAVRESGAEPDAVAAPGDEGAAGTARAMLEAAAAADDAAHDTTGLRVLYPASALANTALQEVLGEAGAEVERVTAYSTGPDPHGAAAVAARLASGDVDAVTLHSPSGVRALCGAAPRPREVLAGVPAVALGPATAEAMEANGLRPAAVADEHSGMGMGEAVLELLDLPRRSKESP